ncbi:putative alpha/Beta hydrolase [Medicago truncatula]|uniref:Alpha/beta-hydrolase superfamily protein n=1 Tax=Medicago truncatula TaxID=3880 RepID=G7ITR8_MEDTR|nr:alpha/beta-hydrolase superfamily protein [Medicago truncatula]RHN75448.1 putative alpha/Beta hydrolase [Medicago truncatula]
MKLRNPFPPRRSSFHIWQGYEDKIVPSELQRFVSWKMPWIQYHEIPDGGHLIICYKGNFEGTFTLIMKSCI